MRDPTDTLLDLVKQMNNLVGEFRFALHVEAGAEEPYTLYAIAGAGRLVQDTPPLGFQSMHATLSTKLGAHVPPEGFSATPPPVGTQCLIERGGKERVCSRAVILPGDRVSLENRYGHWYELSVDDLIPPVFYGKEVKQ